MLDPPFPHDILWMLLLHRSKSANFCYKHLYYLYNLKVAAAKQASAECHLQLVSDLFPTTPHTLVEAEIDPQEGHPYDLSVDSVELLKFPVAGFKSSLGTVWVRRTTTLPVPSILPPAFF